MSMEVPHHFLSYSYKFAKFCDHCGWLLFSLFQKGMKCENCRLFVHTKCQKKVQNKCRLNTVEVLEISNEIGDSLEIANSPNVLNEASSTVSASLEASTSFGANEFRVETYFPTTSQNVQKDKHFFPNFNNKKEVSIKKFNFIKLLSKGAFGKVLLAEKKGTDKLYAVKAIKKDAVLSSGYYINNIKTEKRILTLASGNAFITTLHSCIQSPDRLFFVMEYLSGGNLHFHLQQDYMFDESRVRFYAAEVILALQFLHRHSVIHRNLKLQNILLDREGHCKLTDFAMCWEDNIKNNYPPTFYANAAYIAPETLDGLVYESSVDWWALGSIMYEMMVGETPFQADSQDDLFDSILFGELQCPLWLTLGAVSVLKGLMRKDPTRRLGCSENEIRNHLFFNGLDWEALKQRRVTPPFRPRVKNPKEAFNFDIKYTMQNPILTPEPSEVINQDEFAFF